MLLVKPRTRRVTHAYTKHKIGRSSERAGGRWTIARLVTDRASSCRIHTTTGTHIHTHYTLTHYTHTHYTYTYTHAHARTPNGPNIPSSFLGREQPIFC